MANEESLSRSRPAARYLVIPEEGEPYLQGSRCRACGAIYVGLRTHCAKCASSDTVEPFRMANRGKLYAYCIVHRSFPGVEVPYISAIVDLEGGGSVKGNLIEVGPDPAKIRFDMDVEVVYRDALGRRDAEGNSYISYFFKPA
jgi:hypothetical protein